MYVQNVYSTQYSLQIYIFLRICYHDANDLCAIKESSLINLKKVTNVFKETVAQDLLLLSFSHKPLFLVTYNFAK
jgi:hypothetical protein